MIKWTRADQKYFIKKAEQLEADYYPKTSAALRRWVGEQIANASLE